jgi:hypothetical protein
MIVRSKPRNVLGAEELIELGQAPGTALPGSQPLGTGPRTVLVSRDEGGLIIRVVENIVSFSQSYPIEFQSYCPPDRWQDTLRQVGTWSHEIERQLKEGRQSISVPADAIFRLVDLEKCISAARDARLSAARLAFMIAAGGTVADIVFGLSWVGVPAYLTGLAIILGRPLMARISPEPQEPYRPAISGRECSGETGKLGDHSDKRKVLERVLVCPRRQEEKHHWGRVLPKFGPVESAICLLKDRFRIRVEGWADDVVEPTKGWSRAPLSECEARVELAVWQPCGEPRSTAFGPVREDSGHEETFWVEYIGPLTEGICRRAGPFG